VTLSLSQQKLTRPNSVTSFIAKGKGAAEIITSPIEAVLR